ncbi:MAG TPA: hypothetical protein VM925_07775 [Labilithrix sp.]|nr:hypothetical protein [Labilithrix sp.]
MSLSRFLSIAFAAAALAVPSSAFAAEPATETTSHKTGERAAGEKREQRKPEHLRIGPLVGVGFPRPLAVEGFAKFERLVGVGVEYSFLPRVNLMNVDTSFKALAADLRIFPFKGAFFIGARMGRQWLDAKTTLSAGQLGSFQESMSASTWFVNPRLGFLYTFDSGITVGIDAGVQLPISPSYKRSGAATDAGVASGSDVDQTLVLVSNALGNSTTPTLDLLRLGFLF